MKKPLLIIFLVLLLDQTVKIYVKTHFYMGEPFSVFGNWFVLRFTENNGMAYGMEFGGQYGKLFLSIFRIVAVSGIGYYLFRLIKKKEDKLYIICISLIFAGALGNIIDSAFYGLLFSDSMYGVAKFMPTEGGYASFLQGKVVDMLNFHISAFDGHYPQWFPYWGGETFEFFRPIFNCADASISVGVAMIILYQKRFFKKETKTVTEPQSAVTTEQPAEPTVQETQTPAGN